MRKISNQTAQQTEEVLQETLKRINAYRKSNANDERAIEAFIAAEASHGKHEDPMEGNPAPPNGAVTGGGSEN